MQAAESAVLVESPYAWLPATARILIEGSGEWGWGDLVLLTQERINDFARASGDNNPIHTEKGVAHGMLLISMLPELLRPVFDSFKDGGVQLIDRGGAFSFEHFARAGRYLQAKMRVTGSSASRDKKDVIFTFTFSICTRLPSGGEGKVVATGERTLQCLAARS